MALGTRIWHPPQILQGRMTSSLTKGRQPGIEIIERTLKSLIITSLVAFPEPATSKKLLLLQLNGRKDSTRSLVNLFFESSCINRFPHNYTIPQTYSSSIPLPGKTRLRSLMGTQGTESSEYKPIVLKIFSLK